MTRDIESVRARPAAGGDTAFHPVYARLLFDALQARGLDGRAALAEAGLGEDRLGASAAHLGLAEMRALMRGARAICSDPLLALEWGALARDSVHGTAGTAISSSRDLREALTTLCTVAALRATAVRLRLVEAGDEARLEIAEAVPLQELRDFLLIALALLLAQMVVGLLGAAGGRMRVELPVPEPPWGGACASAFPCPVRFGATMLRIRLSRELLDRRCPAADARAHDAAMRQCALDAMALASRLSARVAAFLGQQEGSYPSLTAVARTFATSPRTLSRRLREEGQPFQALLDAARREAAGRCLRETPLAVEAIADRLGYAHPTNFVRAFRRWHDCTPQEFRLRHSKSARRPAKAASAR